MHNNGRMLMADDGGRAGPLPARGDSRTAPQEAVSRGGQHVLVVDDEWWVRAFVRMALEEAGLAVTEAEDADTALAAMEAMPVRVLVTDLNLGGGPDGLALAAAARRRCPDLRVLYLSGDPDRVHRRAFADWERFVSKPFPVGTVVRAVSEMARPAVVDRARPSLWGAKRLEWLPPSDPPPAHLPA